MNRSKFLEWALVSALYLVLVAIAFWLKAADLAMLALLTAVPITTLLLFRTDMTLRAKLWSAGPIAYAVPAVLTAIWWVESPQKRISAVVAGMCFLIYFVGFFAVVRILWRRRR